MPESNRRNLALQASALAIPPTGCEAEGVGVEPTRRSYERSTVFETAAVTNRLALPRVPRQGIEPRHPEGARLQRAGNSSSQYEADTFSTIPQLYDEDGAP